MPQAEHMTVLDSLALKVHNFLHFLGVSEGTDVATGSVGIETRTNDMSKSNPKLAQEADVALGHVLFAIQAFDRDDLLVLAKRLQASTVAKKETLFQECSEEELRKLLSDAAKRLRKQSPAQTVELARYAVDFARTQLAKAGD